MKPILEIKNISKKFRIGKTRKPYLSLRESIGEMFTRRKQSSEDFYALQDVSFNVEPGESVGIIGKNGAGKSTLLKILSKITPPSSGSITVRGRIASLLEVGTGFHPELSGRENIFLNGSILGMKRKEIENKFDEIVDFSGTEKFLDTALKHFSSGMQLRLAFSVAAFLEPEILVIDEVLAVGDAEFQKKCIGKMEDVSKSGRTILFVSHNMAAVEALCNRCIYLDHGKLLMSGKSNEVVHAYIRAGMGAEFSENSSNIHRDIFLASLKFLRLPGENGTAELEAIIHATKKTKAAVDLRLAALNGTPSAFGSLGTFDPGEMIELEEGENRIQLSFRTNELANGLYDLSVDLTQPDKEYFHRAEHILLFEVLNPPRQQNGRALMQEWGYGNFRLDLKKIK